MSYVLTGIAFIVVGIALFAWHMMRDAPTAVSGEPVQPEWGGSIGFATGDYSGIAAGAEWGGARPAGMVAEQHSPDRIRRVTALALVKATSLDFVGHRQRHRAA